MPHPHFIPDLEEPVGLGELAVESDLPTGSGGNDASSTPSLQDKINADNERRERDEDRARAERERQEVIDENRREASRQEREHNEDLAAPQTTPLSSPSAASSSPSQGPNVISHREQPVTKGLRRVGGKHG